MDSQAEKKNTSNKTIIVAALIIALAIICAGAFIATRPQAQENDDKKIGYATEATVMLDRDSLQAAMDAAMEKAKDGNVALRYRNDAYSKNGTDFECMIANSATNIYDMFLTIYADDQLTDQIFLSGLVPPGSGFENITLDHALEPGSHTVYVALTQVADDEETGEQVIKNQVMHTMVFHVES